MKQIVTLQADNCIGTPVVRRLSLVALLVLAAFLRFSALTRQPLALDESATAEWVQGSLWQCVFAEGQHPPLFHFLVWLLVHVVGLSVWTLRALPALCGVAVVAATWLLAKRLAPGVQLLATLFVTISPFLIYYSQEARSYQMLVLLSLLSTWAFLRAVESGRYGLYTALSVLLLYCSFFGGLVLLAHEIVYWVHYRIRARAWVLGRVAVGAAFLPWVAFALQELMSKYRGVEESPPRWLLIRPLYVWIRLLLGYSVAVMDHDTRRQPVSAFVWQEARLLVPALGCLGLLLLRGSRRLLSSPVHATLFASLIVLPVLLGTCFGVTVERYFAFAAPFLLVLLALGISPLQGLFRYAAVSACVLLFGFCLFGYYLSPAQLFGYTFRFGKENWRGAAEFARAAGGDAIVFSPGGCSRPFIWQWKPGKATIIALPDDERSLDLRGFRRYVLVISDFEKARITGCAIGDQLLGSEDFPEQRGIQVFICGKAAGARSDSLPIH